MDYQTWFNQRIATTAPVKMYVDLPSSFQIGDAIEILLTEDVAPIEGVVYAIKFSGNGAVSYDIAIPIKDAEHYTIITNIRGSMRPKGSDKTEQELQLIDLEEISPLIKRSLLHIVE
jgi:hypothetical protein